MYLVAISDSLIANLFLALYNCTLSLAASFATGTTI